MALHFLGNGKIPILGVVSWDTIQKYQLPHQGSMSPGRHVSPASALAWTQWCLKCREAPELGHNICQISMDHPWDGSQTLYQGAASCGDLSGTSHWGNRTGRDYCWKQAVSMNRHFGVSRPKLQSAIVSTETHMLFKRETMYQQSLNILT